MMKHSSMEDDEIVKTFLANLNKYVLLNREVRHKSLNRTASRVDDHRIKDLERELQEFKMSNTSLILHQTNHSKMVEELRTADKEKIKSLNQQVKNLQKELLQARSDASKSQNNLCTNCLEYEKKVEGLERTTFLLQQHIGSHEDCDQKENKLKEEIDANEKKIKMLTAKNQNLQDELFNTRSEATRIQNNTNNKLERELRSHDDCKEKEKQLKDQITKKDREIQQQRQEITRLREKAAKVEVSGKSRLQQEKKLPKAAKSTPQEKKKYVVVNYGDIFHRLYATEHVKFINFNNTNNLNEISQNLTSYHKQMFIIARDYYMNPDSGRTLHYGNLLSICKNWKKLRPDGEIHLISWKDETNTFQVPTAEIRSLFKSYNTVIIEENWQNDLSTAVTYHWSKYSEELLQ